jgi:hypothetical protein
MATIQPLVRIAFGILIGLLPLAAAFAEESDDSDAVDAEEYVPVKKLFHGFRVGYTFVNPTPDSPLESPHLFVIGYELTQRTLGGDWLNVIMVQNVSVSGINQSAFIPSFNGLVGFEIAEQIQIGTGINFMPFDPSGNYIHMIMAMGYTPKAGAFNVPVHVTYIPDVDGAYRFGITTGVNW